MKSIAILVTSAVLLAMFLNLSHSQNGTSGCDEDLEWCFRFCFGSEGSWCLTQDNPNCASTCSEDASCNSMAPIDFNCTDCPGSCQIFEF